VLDSNLPPYLVLFAHLFPGLPVYLRLPMPIGRRGMAPAQATVQAGQTGVTQLTDEDGFYHFREHFSRQLVYTVTLIQRRQSCVPN
jgi:hypothetical protein